MMVTTGSGDMWCVDMASAIAKTLQEPRIFAMGGQHVLRPACGFHKHGGNLVLVKWGAV
jgi:hypothetical protein